MQTRKLKAGKTMQKNNQYCQYDYLPALLKRYSFDEKMRICYEYSSKILQKGNLRNPEFQLVFISYAVNPVLLSAKLLDTSQKRADRCPSPFLSLLRNIFLQCGVLLRLQLRGFNRRGKHLVANPVGGRHADRQRQRECQRRHNRGHKSGNHIRCDVRRAFGI